MHRKKAPVDPMLKQLLQLAGLHKIPRVPPSTNFFAMPFCQELTLMPWRNRNKVDVVDRALDGSIVLHYHGRLFKKHVLIGVSVGSSPRIIRALRKEKLPLTMAQVIRFSAGLADIEEEVLRRRRSEKALSEEQLKRVVQMRAQALRFVYRAGNPKVPKVILADIEEIGKRKIAA